MFKISLVRKLSLKYAFNHNIHGKIILKRDYVKNVRNCSLDHLPRECVNQEIKGVVWNGENFYQGGKTGTRT